jgi:hypothetical protein
LSFYGILLCHDNEIGLPATRSTADFLQDPGRDGCVIPKMRGSGDLRPQSGQQSRNTLASSDGRKHMKPPSLEIGEIDASIDGPPKRLDR